MVQALIFCPTRLSPFPLWEEGIDGAGFNILPNPPCHPLSYAERELNVPGFNFLPNPPFPLSSVRRGN